MKIGIVCYPTFGGSGVVATELGMELSKRGHEIHFITYKQPVRLAQVSKNIHFHEVNVPEYPLFHYQPYELALSSKLVNMVKKYGIELLHVHYAIPHAYAGYMAQKMLEEEQIHIPMITTLHGTDITLVGSHPFYKPAVTFSINNSDYVTSVSESLKRDTMRLFSIKKDIRVIPNFIDISKHRVSTDEQQRKLIADEDEYIITHVSNFRKVKRIDDVVYIFYKIQQRLKAKLLLVGEGPEVEPARHLVNRLHMEDKVFFMGESNEVNKILGLSDLFLLPSEAESFGLAALEAMVNGVPVISSDVGGLPEVNKNGISGFLNPPGDIEGMARNALYILEDKDRLRQFKSRAQATAEQFDIDKIVPFYEEIYRESLMTGKQPA